MKSHALGWFLYHFLVLSLSLSFTHSHTRALTTYFFFSKIMKVLGGNSQPISYFKPWGVAPKLELKLTFSFSAECLLFFFLSFCTSGNTYNNNYYYYRPPPHIKTGEKKYWVNEYELRLDPLSQWNSEALFWFVDCLHDRFHRVQFCDTIWSEFCNLLDKPH